MELDLERWIKPAIAGIAIAIWLFRRLAVAARSASPRIEPSRPGGEVSNRPIHPR
jgi:hypothetical protein